MSDFLHRALEWLQAHANAKTVGVALVVVAVIAFCSGNAYEDWRSDGKGLTLVNEEIPTPTAAAEAPEGTDNAPAPTEIKVHVVGAVAAPGVYAFTSGDRIDDAVRAAGVNNNADLSQLNLAQKLIDGQKIVVPAEGETPAPTTAPPSGAEPSNGEYNGEYININTASLEELKKLPGIGEVRAKAIIQYRENEPFQVPEDLMKVNGIGEKTFEDAKPFIVV